LKHNLALIMELDTVDEQELPTINLDKNKLENVLTCPICRNIKFDMLPFTCGHSICRLCSENYNCCPYRCNSRYEGYRAKFPNSQIHPTTKILEAIFGEDVVNESIKTDKFNVAVENEVSRRLTHIVDDAIKKEREKSDALNQEIVEYMNRLTDYHAKYIFLTQLANAHNRRQWTLMAVILLMTVWWWSGYQQVALLMLSIFVLIVLNIFYNLFTLYQPSCERYNMKMTVFGSIQCDEQLPLCRRAALYHVQ